MFDGRADWSVIARVKEQARIPIIGNGDVFAPEDAARMFNETRVDGVMVGRGVLSNPWLIRQCCDHLTGTGVRTVSLHERAEFMASFLRRVSAQVPAAIALGKMKKAGGYLSKGIPGGAHLRAAIHAARTSEELLETLDEFLSARGCHE
jgi:tRNA-dihydrouridine synthase